MKDIGAKIRNSAGGLKLTIMKNMKECGWMI